MKKFTYLVIATAALGMVACTGGNKAGYVVTGTVEGASDGDTVYLQEANGRNLVKLDTAVITKGTFTFEGTQDSVVSRYITCEVDGEPLMIDFFLENGKNRKNVQKWRGVGCCGNRWTALCGRFVLYN